MSEIYYAWVNEVAEGVLAVHPDKRFGLVAYGEVYDPPATVELNPHVIPFLTEDRMAWADQTVKEASQNKIIAWESAAGQIGWYDYMYGTPYALPRMYTDLMADNYRFAAEHKVTAQYSELYPNWGEGPKPWVSAKLQWNPNQDEEQLEQEWYGRAVGEEAAEHLEAYYAIWERFWTVDIPQSAWFHAWRNSPVRVDYLPFRDAGYLMLVDKADIEESRRLLELAVAKAQTDPQRTRANKLLRAFEYYEASALSFPSGSATPYPQSEVEALQLVEDGVTRLQYGERRLELVEEFKEDPVLVHALEPKLFSLVWSGWDGTVFKHLVDWLKQEPPQLGAVHLRVQELADSQQNSVSQFAKLLMAASSSALPENVNSSFETGDTGAPPWSFWIKSGGEIIRSDEHVQSGQYSLRITGLTRGGPVQKVHVEEGAYGTIAYVYMPGGSNSTGSVQISLNLLTSAGQVITSMNSPVTPLTEYAPGDWGVVQAVMDIPAQARGKEVDSVQLIIIVDGVAAEETIYLDDVQFFRLDG
ncbi:DUF4838 domain-containing protein [Paenibacillus sp. J5C_2022]|nr:DUF4838 domain-containing protein [Paenibacillus sp. J5C2022]MCU6710951.1 DUF4838 domain-containing protein [Paenibacillus sp. J5C2022]